MASLLKDTTFKQCPFCKEILFWHDEEGVNFTIFRKEDLRCLKEVKAKRVRVRRKINNERSKE